jgi:hypothetical protein
MEKRLIMLAMSRIQWGDDECSHAGYSGTELAQLACGNPYQEGRKAATACVTRVVDVLDVGEESRQISGTTFPLISGPQTQSGCSVRAFPLNESSSSLSGYSWRRRYKPDSLTHMLALCLSYQLAKTGRNFVGHDSLTRVKRHCD